MIALSIRQCKLINSLAEVRNNRSMIASFPLALCVPPSPTRRLARAPVWPDSGGGLALAAKPLVCGSDSTLAVATFEPAHHEVRTRHLLEVVDEGVVHRCTTERADDRHGLRCELLRHYHAKAGRYLRNEPDQDRCAFREHAAFGDEARGLRDRFGEQRAGSEIPAFPRIRLAIACAQGEYLEAGEGALG